MDEPTTLPGEWPAPISAGDIVFTHCCVDPTLPSVKALLHGGQIFTALLLSTSFSEPLWQQHKPVRIARGDSCLPQAVPLSSAISTLSCVLARKYRGRFMKGLNSAANIGLVYTELSTLGEKKHTFMQDQKACSE